MKISMSVAGVQRTPEGLRLSKIPGLAAIFLTVALGLGLMTSGQAKAQVCFSESFDESFLVSSAVPVSEGTGCTEQLIEVSSEQRLRNVLRGSQRQIRNRMGALQRGIISQRNPEEEQQADLGFADYQSAEAGAAATDSRGIGVWGDISVSKLESEIPLVIFQGSSVGALLGADMLLGDRAIVGAMLGAETSEFDLINGGERNIDGGSIAIYGGMLLDDVFSVDALLSYALLDNDISQGFFFPISGSFDSDRLAFAANVSGMWQFEDYFLTGTLGYAYAEEDFDSYVNSIGATVNPSYLTLSQIRLGGEVARPMEYMEPFVELVVEHDLENAGFGDDTGAFATLGLRSLPMDGITVGTQVSGQFFREDEDDVTFGANVRVSF